MQADRPVRGDSALVAAFEALWTDGRSKPLDAMSHAVTSADRHPRGGPADRGGPPVTMLV